MQSIKKLVKKAFKLDPKSNLTPLKNMVHVGSKLHGYFVPADYLNEKSICYCVGAGQDISFDTELVVKFGCKVVIFDPMPEGKNHFKKLIENTKGNKKTRIEYGKDTYEYNISSDQLAGIKFIEIGIWDKESTIKFYEPSTETYVSHSITNIMKTDKFIEAPVDRLSNQMKKLKHKSIDLVKIEIEGAEYTVIDTIAEDKLDIKMVMVEFDEVYHSKGFGYLKRIKNSSDKLLDAGYKIVHSTDHFKRTFMQSDLYKVLKSKEGK